MLTQFNCVGINISMETNFKVRSKTSHTPMFLSLGPTISQGEIVYGTMQVGNKFLEPIPYRWNEIEKLFQKGELIVESDISLSDVRKYCGNANEAIAKIGNHYFCPHCYQKSFGFLLIEPFEMIPKKEEHYCDACQLS